MARYSSPFPCCLLGIALHLQGLVTDLAYVLLMIERQLGMTCTHGKGRQLTQVYWIRHLMTKLQDLPAWQACVLAMT